MFGLCRFWKIKNFGIKIAYLISKGEAPESIIAFIFIEKAAEFTKRRITEALYKFGLSEKFMYIGRIQTKRLDFCHKD